jgi:hypothetical protein
VDSDPIGYVDPTGLFKIGGSLYAGFGGGLSLTFTRNGIGICSEGGLGEGVGIDVDPWATLPRDETTLVGGLGVGALGTGVETPFGPCWASGRYARWDGGSASWLPKQGTEAIASELAKGGLKQPKLGLQYKLALRGCGSYYWQGLGADEDPRVSALALTPSALLALLERRD